jgi:DeoR/GlpR family transcriptional regulator of sugar metabolism
MVASASEVIALIDHTKWGRAAFATFCPTDRLTGVVTDDEAPAGMTNALLQRRILVHVAQGLGKPAAPGSRLQSDVQARDALS